MRSTNALGSLCSLCVLLIGVGLPGGARATLAPGERHTVAIDRHQGDEATTTPKRDANDGDAGDNPAFRRHNVARAHCRSVTECWWYTSTHQEPGEPSPTGEQWVDYVPPLSTLGPGRYEIFARYYVTENRATYPARYVAHHACGQTVIERSQREGTGMVTFSLGRYDLGGDGWVRVEDTGPGSIAFAPMTFQYLGPSRAATSALSWSADRRGLEYHGLPVALVGDDAGRALTALGADWSTVAYLDALAERGITLVELDAFAAAGDPVDDPLIGYAAPGLWPWTKNGDTFNPRQLDPVYLERLRALVSAAAERDILVLLTLHDGRVTERFAQHPLCAANGGTLTAPAQYLVLDQPQRFITGGFDASWSDARKHQFYLERFEAAIAGAVGDLPNVIFQVIRTRADYATVPLRRFVNHTLQHLCYLTDAPLVVDQDLMADTDYRGVRTCALLVLNQLALTSPGEPTLASAGAVFAALATLRGETPPRPLLVAGVDSAFVGDTAHRLAWTRVAWGAALARAGVVVPNPTVWGFAPRAAVAARATERDAMLDAEGALVRLVSSLELDASTLAPHGELSSTGVCLARPGELYVAYSESGPSLSVDLSAATGSFLARFYDPLLGALGPPEAVSGGDPRQSFAKPDAGDWVLVISRGALPPAGDPPDDDPPPRLRPVPSGCAAISAAPLPVLLLVLGGRVRRRRS